MRPSCGFVIAVLAVGWLAGCATSRDTIVLLPKADGSTGAIAASRDGQEVLLDSAYASARPGLGGKLKHGTEDRDSVEKRFGAALAAMPPAAKSFTVYFLSGSDDFTDESKSTITQMLEEMRQRPSPEVTVIGHTDMVGSDEDNDALSLQRAQRVKEMLVALGVSTEHISTAGRGAREPLVATERGVDEPKNRRVEVSVR
jgi:outer membrane protein OmpA-like peptidoglycan-associated protein